MENNSIREEYVSSLEDITSKEYREFKKTIDESRKRRHWYEKLAGYVSAIDIELSPKDREKIERGIRFSGLNIKPRDVFLIPSAFFLVSLLLQIIFYIAIKVLESKLSEPQNLIGKILYPGNWPVIIKFLPILIGVIGAYFLYKYPFMISTRNRLRYGEELLMAIVYMIVYLRTSGNLEGALRYAAQNTRGKVSQDLNELLWKIEMRRYLSAYEALNDYANLWKDYMKEFSQAIYLINEAMMEPETSRRDMLLEKALGVVLDSYNEKMKAYSRALELPIQVIHAFGIILPVLGMVVLPILTILLSDSIKNLSFYLISFYDIVLPIVLMFFINNTLEKRPPTFGRVDVSRHPSLPKKGYFRMCYKEKTIDIKISHVLYGALFFFLLPSSIFFLYNYYLDGNSSLSITFALLCVISFAIMIMLHGFLTSANRLSLRKEIEEIEKEFEEALFALGNSLAGGVPVEKGLVRAVSDIGNLKIKNLFEDILRNMHQFSLTFKGALFHPRYGVIKYYPSELIKNILNILSSVIEKGTENAALAMITISRYLRDIRTTQEKIEDLLSSTLSSMRFNAYVLIPIVGGVIVAVSKLVLILLLKMSGVYSALSSQLSAEEAQSLMETGFVFDIEQAIPSSITLLIIGIYIVEILYILGIFISRTQYGYDEIMEKHEIWKLTLIGTSMFVASYLVINGMFSGVIDSIIDSLSNV